MVEIKEALGKNSTRLAHGLAHNIADLQQASAPESLDLSQSGKGNERSKNNVGTSCGYSSSSGSEHQQQIGDLGRKAREVFASYRNLEAVEVALENSFDPSQKALLQQAVYETEGRHDLANEAINRCSEIPKDSAGSIILGSQLPEEVQEVLIEEFRSREGGEDENQ